MILSAITHVVNGCLVLAGIFLLMIGPLMIGMDVLAWWLVLHD